MLEYNCMKSDFLLMLSSKKSDYINQCLIKPLVKSFFLSRGVLDFSSLKASDSISDIDFKKIEFSYYYDIVMRDIHKKQNDIDFSVKYILTVDPESCLSICEKTGVRYDAIYMSCHPILYFIYIDIKDILSFVRNEN